MATVFADLTLSLDSVSILGLVLNPDISHRSPAETGKSDGSCVRLTL